MRKRNRVGGGRDRKTEKKGNKETGRKGRRERERQIGPKAFVIFRFLITFTVAQLLFLTYDDYSFVAEHRKTSYSK